MKISGVTKLNKQCLKEAQKAVDAIFKKYSVLIQKEIEKELPQSSQLTHGNGMVMLQNRKGKQLEPERSNYGNAWSISADSSPKLDKLALIMQYGTTADELQGVYPLPSIIKSQK